MRIVLSASSEHSSGPGVPSARSGTAPFAAVQPEAAQSRKTLAKRSARVRAMLADLLARKPSIQDGQELPTAIWPEDLQDKLLNPLLGLEGIRVCDDRDGPCGTWGDFVPIHA